MFRTNKSALLLIFSLVMSAFHALAATPQLVSLSPSSGSGQTQNFTLTASDSAGASDISSIDMLINSSFSKQNACWVYFDNAHKQLALYLDNQTWSQPAGAGESAQNSQCTAQLVSSSDSGNNAGFTVAITFSGAWLGSKTIWGESLDLAKDDSGFQQAGTFDVTSTGPAPDLSITVSPTSATIVTGSAGFTYNVEIYSINQFTGTVYFSDTVSPSTPGLSVTAPPSVFIPANGAGTTTVTATAASDTTPTNNITITIMYTSGTLQHSVPVVLNVISPNAPTVSISPSSGSGSTQTFNVMANDQGGYKAVSSMNFLINSSFNGENGCWFYYQPDPQQNGASASGTLYLASDDTTTWSSGTHLSSGQTTVTPVGNSQCGVFGGPTTVTGNGDTLTLTITLTFTSSFTGGKGLYVRASDASGLDSSYREVGTFTTKGGTAGPDFNIQVSPPSQSVTGKAQATYSIAVTGINGYSGTPKLTITGVPPNSTLTPPTNVGPNQSTTFTVNTTGSTPTGDFTLTVTGTDGSLSHSQNVELAVQSAGVPTLSASPNTGSGLSQTFTFTATGQDSAASPVQLNVLFSQTFIGSNACWMYYNGNQLYLASDDGSIWAGSNGTSPATLQNSQCTLSAISPMNSATQLSFNVTITFNRSFDGAKNIYMHASNQQGGDTGYPVEGSWTVQ